MPYLTNAEKNELKCLKTSIHEGILDDEEFLLYKTRMPPGRVLKSRAVPQVNSGQNVASALLWSALLSW